MEETVSRVQASQLSWPRAVPKSHSGGLALPDLAVAMPTLEYLGFWEGLAGSLYTHLKCGNLVTQLHTGLSQ